MTERKKLIEVALPIDAINDASAYDKMPGVGAHPKGLQKWWAQLPLPCARAILFASLVDDPSSNPEKFESEEEQQRERDRLFDLMRRLVRKGADKDPDVFREALRQIKTDCGDDLPTLVDGFCGSGAIPLEGQRLGLSVRASDLNPIAVLLTKALIELPQRFIGMSAVGPTGRLDQSQARIGIGGLVEDIRHYGQVVYERASTLLAPAYPKASNGATIIAWIWARSVRCPNPACGVLTPLVRSFSLSTKKGKRAWVEPRFESSKKQISYRVASGDGEPPNGTVSRQGARCFACRSPITFDHIRSEGRSGQLTNRLLALVGQKGKGRLYLPPDEQHEAAAAAVTPLNVPESDLPERALGFRVQLYGMTRHADLFTPRQLRAMEVLSDLVVEVHAEIAKDAVAAGLADDDVRLRDGGRGAIAYADAVTTYLAFAVNRLADFNNALCRWKPSGEQVIQLFNRQAVPMVWDFAESNLLGRSSISWHTAINIVADSLAVVIPSGLEVKESSVRQLDAATASPLANGEKSLVSTDPPYYDNIGYSDLSDLFYVWSRRTLSDIYPDLFATLLTPKSVELVATPYRFDGDRTEAKEHFESGFRRAFSLMKERLDPRFPMTVYYAFKQAEAEVDDIESGDSAIATGWETMLGALIATGFHIVGTWPVRASQAWRMVSMGTNALASYIILVCRPRALDAPLATRREFLAALKNELPVALKALQHGNIAPVDLAQASLGPGMAVFTRFAKVVEADGTSMSVRNALALINQALDEVLAEQESEYDAATRWAVAWFDQYGETEGPYGVAETLSKAKNTAVGGLVAGGIVKAKGGKVRLLPKAELARDWDPTTDRRLTVWEVAQQIVRALEEGGEEAAASVVRRVGALSETARDLAYRLYTTCERKKWAQEALSYNSLVVAWPEIQRLAGAGLGTETQEGLF